jgi:hypothetical protein
MNEDVNFLDKLDRISTSFYTQNNDSFNKNNEKNEKDIKKVKFHKKLTVISVESYKQYNKEHTYPRKSNIVYKKVSCKCYIF